MSNVNTNDETNINNNIENVDQNKLPALTISTNTTNNNEALNNNTNTTTKDTTATTSTIIPPNYKAPPTPSSAKPTPRNPPPQQQEGTINDENNNNTKGKKTNKIPSSTTTTTKNKKTDIIKSKLKRQRQLLIGRGQDSGGKFQAACLSSNGKLGLTVRDEDSNFQVYSMEINKNGETTTDYEMGELITNVELDYEWGKVFAATFSPDSRRIFLTFWDGVIRYWKRPDTEQERQMKLERIQEKERLENEKRFKLQEEARLEEEQRLENERLERERIENERREEEERIRQQKIQERKDKLLKENESNNNNNDNVENNNNISNQEQQQQGPPKEEEKKELSEFEKMKLMMLSAADEYQELRNEYETEFGEQWSPVHNTSKPTGDDNNETSTTANSSPTKVFTFDNVDIEKNNKNNNNAENQEKQLVDTIGTTKVTTTNDENVDENTNANTKQPKENTTSNEKMIDNTNTTNENSTTEIQPNNNNNNKPEKEKRLSSKPIYDYRLNGELKGHKKNIQCIAIQGDGKRVLTACEDETLKYWSIKKQSCLSTLRGHKGEVLACDMYTTTAMKNEDSLEENSKNNNNNNTSKPIRNTYAASGSTDKHIRLWKMDTTFKPKSKEDPGGRGWKCEWCFEDVHETSVNLVRFIPPSKTKNKTTIMPRLTTASLDGVVALLCLETMCPLMKILCFQNKRINGLSVSSDATSFLNVCEDGSCTLWNYKSSKQTAQLLPPNNAQGKGVYGCWHQDGQILCTGEEGWSLWNGNDAKPEIEKVRCSKGGDDASVTSVNFSTPDGELLATSSGDGMVRVYAMSDLAKEKYKLHQSLTTISNDGDDNNNNNNSEYLLFEWKCTDGGEVLYTKFTPNLKTLVACCDDGNIRLYNWDNPNAPPITLEGHEDAVTSCAFSNDNTKMASVSWDGTAKIWDLEAHKPIVTCNGHDGWVRCCTLGRFLITGDDEGYIRVFVIGGEEPQQNLKIHDGAVNSLCYNTDETNLLSCSDDGTLHVINLQSYETVCKMEGHRDAVNAACYTKDGFGIVSVSSDRTLRLWNATFGHPLVTFGCGEDEVMTIDVAPDNVWSVVTSGKDGFIRFWSIDFESYY